MWKAHKDRRLHFLWKQNLTDAEMARRMEVAPRQIKHHREKLGLKRHGKESNAPKYETETPTYMDKINPLWLGQAYIGLDPATMCIHENGGLKKLTLDQVVKEVNKHLKDHGLKQLQQFPECFV